MTKLCPRGKAAAKRKFKVYPSAYANAYASKICAGKIKDPSGVKRKDFRGPKPTGAKDGKMISRDQRQKEIRKKQNPISEYDEKGKLKYTAAKKGKAMMTAGSQSAIGRIQKAKMVKARMGKAVDYQNYLKGLKKIENKTNLDKAVKKRKDLESKGNEFLKRRKELGGRALRAAKATRIGKIAAGVAGVGLAAKAFLNKKLEESKAKKKVDKKKMGGLKAELNNPAKGYMAGGMADYYKDLM